MPIKSEANSQFFCEIDGELKPIGMGVTIEGCQEIVQDVENAIHNLDFYMGGEIKINISRKEHKRFKRILQSIIPRYWTNNWRKMHGMRTTRRIGKWV